MKKILLILILLLSISTYSQDKERHERIKALKIAFITERLELTTTEAQNFWPIYNAFDAENQRLRQETKGKFRKVDFESMTDQEAKSHVEYMMATDTRKHDLKQKFANDLLKVLPAKKIILLKATEDAFNRRMMEQFRKRREGSRKENRP
ncbi:MAG: sensor of ECF-type sigma factor [Flavobacteriaceae bacterium]|nr:sensor of ECF-type sigma factor [Bacteroidia bacterium]NNL16938.1 sensor of ECF-type sigma factor [Flavobacteriaceae bacterium]